MSTLNPPAPVVCAIHQPNLFPRFSTIAKLYASDIWVVLDDVQFNARDYQHRARLAPPADPERQQWLTLPVHRPHGRDSKINEVQMVDVEKSALRLAELPRQIYGSAPHFADVATIIGDTAEMVGTAPCLAAVTEFSTLAILEALGWPGQVVRSSSYTARADKSARLADLCRAMGADVYLCGTGGARYLDEQPFHEHGVQVRYFDPPVTQQTRRLTSLHHIAANGTESSRIRLEAGCTVARSETSRRLGHANAVAH